MRGLIFIGAMIAVGSTLASAASSGRVSGLPILFQQAAPDSAGGSSYLARGRGYSLRLGAVGLQLRSANGASTVIRFAGRVAGVAPEASGPPAARVNDYTGSRTRWVTDAPAWNEVRYRGVYPGIDLRFYGKDGAMEYDALVEPGADPSRIGFDFDGPAKMRMTPAGDLAIAVGSATVTWRKPMAYQEIDGRRVAVEASLVLKGHRAGFQIGKWDRRYSLTIDPTLTFSTLLGGSGNEVGRGIAVDASGNVYIAGATSSGDLPVTGSSSQPSYKGGSEYGAPSDAFVAKLNATGTAISYVTYLGGTNIDWATAIAVDSSGNAYVTGFTDSSDFPVTAGVYQAHFGGDMGDGNSPTGDAFVTKFDPTGKLVWSTYLGGGQDDTGSAIAFDSAGDVIVAGATVSSNFPTSPSGYQTRYGGGSGPFTVSPQGYVTINSGDAFLAKLDPTGAKLLAGTYLGGSGDDAAASLAVDAQGNIWAAGATASSNFSVTSGAFQSKFGGVSGDNLQAIFKLGDGFISEFSSDLSKLSYSTYLGGSLDDAVLSIAVDSTGAVFACGLTHSANFPVKGASAGIYHGPAQPPNQRPYMLGDGFVAKLVPASGLVFAQYLGGRDDDAAAALALDSQGNVFLTGVTNSSDFPVTSDALQAKFGGSGASPYDGIGDGFLTQINGSTGAVMYSTFLGSTTWDAMAAVAVSSSGSVYLLGYTASPNFVTTPGVVQASLKAPASGNADLAIMRFSFASATAPSVGGVANSASYSTAVYSPGEIVTIFGANIGPATVTTAQIDSRTGRIATTLGGVQVLFDGTPAPLVYVSATQSSAIIPYEVLGKSSTVMTVSYNGATSPGVSLKLGSAAPGLFSLNQQGTGQGAIVNQDNTFNSTSNPAPVGTYISIYGTGEGPLSPAGATGQLAPSAPPFPTFAGSLSVTVAGIFASNVAYAGPVPGFVDGEFQINLQIPPGVPSGNQPVVVIIGGVSSLSNFTVAVK